MPDVDLGDRSEFIDLIYGPPREGSVSAANSLSSINKQPPPPTPPPVVTTNTPSSGTYQQVRNENGRNERLERKQAKKDKKSSKIACSCCCILCLVLLAALAIAGSGFAAYWITKQNYENRLAMASYIPLERRQNTSVVDDAPPLDLDEVPEKDAPMPSLEQLKLPENIKPLGYNVSLKVPLTKNGSIEGNVQIRLNILEETNKIVLNGKGLILPAAAKLRLLTEPKKIRRRDTENMSNMTMNSGEEPEDVKDKEEEMENNNTQGLMKEVKQEKPPMKLIPAGVKVLNVDQDDVLEKITLTLDNSLSPGEVILQFPFEAKPSDGPNGPFLATFKNSDGTTSTGFTLAGGIRKLFPSFDDKNFAAPLKLSVIHPKDTVVLTNGPDSDASTDEVESGWVETVIEKPTASGTSLNIFPFEKRSEQAKNDREIRIWSRPEAYNSTEFGLETAVQIVNLLQDFYATTLSSETLDIVAVPGLLVGQSVPGQIQVPETSVLYDPTVDDIVNKVHIVQQLSQQLNKQFIGDIVPESDSKSEWIEEAMAHFVEKNALDNFFGSPEATNQHILINSVEKALSLDAQSSSHPLVVDRETLRESTVINDVVSKEKGAAVLRMLQYVIGKNAFRQGIRHFFASTTNGQATYEELWSALQENIPNGLKSWDGSDFKVADFANKWVQQMGYPVVEVYRLDPQNVELTQKRFKLDKRTPEQAKFRNAVYWYKWDIPLNYWINGDVKDMNWLHEAIRLPLNISDELLINGHAEGYYRVNYDEEGWQDIAKLFNNDHGSLSASARARVLSDVFALAASHDLLYKTAFNVTEYLPAEESYAPIAVALEGLLDIYNRLDDSEEAVKAKEFILKKIEAQFSALPEFATLTSQEKEDFLEIKKNLVVLEAYCKLKHEDCRKQLSGLSEDKLIAPCMKANFTSQCSKVPPALRPTVYCDAVAYGDDGVFEAFVNYSQNEPVATERKRLVSALGCSRDPLAIRRLLKNSLSNDTQLGQDDIPVFLTSLSKNDVGSLIVSDFLLDNWKELRNRLSNDVYTLSTALTNGLRPSNKRQLKLLELFVQEHPSAKAFGSFRNQLEKGRSNLEWQLRNSAELAKLFKEL